MKYKSQIILTILSSILVVLILSVTVARTTFSRTLLDSKKDFLFSQCNYIKEALVNKEPSILDKYSIDHKVRVTLIEEEGLPIYDSMVDYSKMENHYYRPEIIGSRENIYFTSIRESSTTLSKTLYCAVYYPDSKIYVRTAANIEELNVWDSKFLSSLIPFISVVTLIVLLIAIILVQYLNRPIAELSLAAKKYGEGDFSTKTAISKPEEFAMLSKTMNQMADDIANQVEKLTDDRNTFSSILSSMVEGVLVTDSDKHIVLCNGAAIKMFGLDVTTPITTISLFNDINLDTMISEVLEFGNVCKYELVRYGHLSGETAKLISKGNGRTYQLMIAPITQEERTSGTVITFNDISEIKHLEEVRKDFVANVSHELKTPLTSIDGFANIIVNEKLPEEKLNKFAQIIEKNTKQMKEIIEDLLILASLEKEGVQVPMNEENLFSIIEDAINIASYSATEKNITINVDCNNSLELYCARNLLRQAISNLIVNAIAYSNPSKKIEVQVIEKRLDLEIRVKDHGFGIPVKDQARIFERFYRVDKARSRVSGGTGLGLSIVKHIITLHEGSITLESKESVGSTFIINIPKEKREIRDLKEKSHSLYPNI